MSKYLDINGTQRLIQEFRQELGGKQDVINDLDELRSNLGSAYQKPQSGIPASDIASGVIPTNVSSLTNDANYVTQDTLDDVLGVDANGLIQIKEVLSDDDTTTGLINLIGQKVDSEDVQTITDNEISRLFNPTLFLRASLEESGTSIIVNEIGKIVTFVVNGNQYIIKHTSEGYSSENTNAFNSSTASFGSVQTPIQVITANEGEDWEFDYSNIRYTFNLNSLTITPVISQF